MLLDMIQTQGQNKVVPVCVPQDFPLKQALFLFRDLQICAPSSIVKTLKHF